MGIRKMSGTGRPLNEKDLQAIEKKLGVRLPTSYRQFLLQYNGGSPEPYAYGEQGTLRYFYGVNPTHDCYDLLRNYKRARRDLPAGVIPIATSPFGDDICLATRGKNRGKVYFCDHEGASPNIDPRVEFPWLDLSDLGEDYEFKGDDWPGYPDLSLVADSFDEFLDSFHDGDDKAPKRRKKKPATKKPSQRRKT